MRPRLACAILVLSAAASAAAAAPTAADSGPAVVSATIYSGSSGGVKTRSVTLGTLDGCPLYGGSNPMYLYPGDQAYAPAVSSSWPLTTVITCGLGQPLGNVTEVQVNNPSRGFESPLSNAGISDPGQYHDPAAPNALPVVSVDGTENQDTYARPWLGGSDDNAADEVISDGTPIAVVLYENGLPLTVNATQRTTSRSATAIAVELSATVRTPQGALVPGSDLTWNWNFGDGATSTDSAPRHSFVPGSYPVTVQVTDPSAGTGGTATLQVSLSPSSGSGSGNRSGAGRRSKSRAPSGPLNTSGNHPGGKPGTASGASATAGTRDGSGGAAASRAGRTGNTGAHANTASAASGHASPASAASPHGSQRPSPSAPPPAPTRAPTTSPPQATDAVAPDAPVVVGQLISDVTPLPPSATPLLRATPAALASAPPVRATSRTSSLAVAGGLVLVLLVFGAGAAREVRGPLRWRGPRLPS